VKKDRVDFTSLNRDLTRRVLEELESGKSPAVLAEAPPGAGKSTLTTSVANSLAATDKGLRVPIVSQTNEQADDLVRALASNFPKLTVARLTGGGGASTAVQALLSKKISATDDIELARQSQVIVGTARKWQYVRANQERRRTGLRFEVALIDEAYQMRSDALLGIAGLYKQLFCVGDPGQLDPFTIVDDSLWKGLWYSPARTAMGTLRSAHPELKPILLPTSWRLPPSAAGVVVDAFYPTTPFNAGTSQSQRSLNLGRKSRRDGATIDLNAVLEQGAATGWAYVELPERLTVRTDHEVAESLAALVATLLKRGALVVDERNRSGRQLAPRNVAVITAHNDQVQAARKALSGIGVDPDVITVSTANKIQGREYDVVFVWHPLAGRRDATAFHLEAGRMCVMLSRHRHACIVVGRAGASRLLAEYPDSDPIYLEEPEKFPDGWQANYLVLEHLRQCRV
jgi:hypothetical protein